jgi:hypothetical protein
MYDNADLEDMARRLAVHPTQQEEFCTLADFAFECAKNARDCPREEWER